MEETVFFGTIHLCKGRTERLVASCGFEPELHYISDSTEDEKCRGLQHDNF